MNDVSGEVGPIQNVYTSMFGFVVPLIMGFTSVVASLATLYIMWRSIKGFSSTYHRLIAATSISDIFMAVAIGLTTIPMPKDGDDPLVDEYGFEGVRLGNAQTCTAQAFFHVFGSTASLCYASSLCIYYVTAIAFTIAESKIERVVEPLLHIASLIVSLGLALSFLFLELIGNPDPLKSSWCTLLASSVVCNNEDCLQNSSSLVVKIHILGFVFLCIHFCIIVVSLCLVLQKVFHQRRMMAHYLQAVLGPSPIANRLNLRNRTTVVASIQSLAYIFSFVLTWAFPIIDFMVRKYSGDNVELTVIGKLRLIFQPSRGIFNFLVFVSSKIYLLRYSYPYLSNCGALRRLFSWKQSNENEVITGINFSRGDGGGIEPVLDDDLVSWQEFESDAPPISNFNVGGSSNNVSKMSSSTCSPRRRMSPAGDE